MVTLRGATHGALSGSWPKSSTRPRRVSN